MLQENQDRIIALIGDETLSSQVLAIIAEDEAERRALLVQKQTAGLQNARERGVRLGRPPAKRPRRFQSVYEMYADGQISARSASQMLNVSPGTFKRWVTEEKERSKD
jgi:DNA invertase Pin-like site-specific DNA recombinase